MFNMLKDTRTIYNNTRHHNIRHTLKYWTIFCHL